jgi:hypothetical protein
MRSSSKSSETIRNSIVLPSLVSVAIWFTDLDSYGYRIFLSFDFSVKKIVLDLPPISLIMGF